MKVGNFLNRLIFNLKLFWNSFFVGLKTADEKTMGVTKDGKTIDSSIEQQMTEEGVYADLLRGEVTQEVEELRDANYRDYKQSFDYQYIGNGNVMKKDENMLAPKVNVFNPENLPIYLIQDTLLITHSVSDSMMSVDEDGIYKDVPDEYPITIERDVFPRFLIEKYAKKIVVRRGENNDKIDLYCSMYSRAHRPTDSLFITELYNILNKKVRESDTILIDTVEFVTNGCYGAKDITFFKFGNLTFEGINTYDGNFVLTYSAIPICDGLDLTEEYRTESLDKKYENKELREGATISFENIVEKETYDSEQALSLLSEFNKN